MAESTTVRSTAALFIRLKLRLIANGVRQSGMAAVGTVMGAAAALAGGALGFWLGLASGRADPADAAVWAVLIPAVLAIGWTLLPLVAFGTDETLDPARLAHLPLPAPRLVAGLAAASAVGFGPAAVLATLVGVWIGQGRTGVGALLVPVALVLHGALCIVLARALATALAGLLASRRGQDVALTAAGMIGFVALGAGQLAQRIDQLGADGLQPLADGLAWTPFGWAGRAIADVGAGSELAAVGRLALLAGVVAVVGWWWARVLAAPMERGVAGPGTSARQRGRARARWPATVWGAVAAKEWRYLRREPRRRVQLLVAVVVGAVLPLSIVLSAPDPDPPAVLTSSVAGYLAVLTSFNQFGNDGGALWMNVVAGNRVRDELLGKNLVAAVVVFVASALAALVLAVVTGGWAYLPVAVLLAVAATGIGLGVADVTSAIAPVPLPESSNPFAAAGGGQGCVAAIIYMAAMGVLAVLMAPVAIAVVVALAAAPATVVLVALAAIPYGWLIWRLGLRLAVRRLWWRQAELLALVDPRTA